MEEPRRGAAKLTEMNELFRTQPGCVLLSCSTDCGNWSGNCQNKSRSLAALIPRVIPSAGSQGRSDEDLVAGAPDAPAPLRRRSLSALS